MEGLALLQHLRLLDAVFALPAPLVHRDADLAGGVACARRVDALLAHVPNSPAVETRAALLLAAFVWPWRALQGASEAAYVHVLFEALKLPKKEVDLVAAFVSQAARLGGAVAACVQGDVHAEALSRRALGRVLRDAARHGAAVVALAVVLASADAAPSPERLTQDAALRTELWQIVERLELQDVWQLKPHYNGKELMAALKLTPGAVVGRLLEAQLEWQLAHPKGTREECLAHLATLAQ